MVSVWDGSTCPLSQKNLFFIPGCVSLGKISLTLGGQLSTAAWFNARHLGRDMKDPVQMRGQREVTKK